MGVLISRKPDLWERIRILGESACNERLDYTIKEDPLPFRCWIFPAKGRRPIPIFKTLISNFCVNNCLYCAFGRYRDVPRFRLSPDELARAFWQLYTKGLVKGAFLSSSVDGDPDLTTQRLIETAEILREKYGFKGYIHLKVMPGASEEALRKAVKVGSRVSVNLEAPGPSELKAISKEKDFEVILRQIKVLQDLIKEGTGMARDQTTQFVVGASGETDQKLLLLVESLLKDYELKRCYFEAFTPVPRTPLEHLRPENPLRVVRLYQASFLLRDYGFRTEELVFDKRGRLPLEYDPKLLWALRNPAFFPVDLKKAEPEELLRVPGFGPLSVSKILKLRSEGTLSWESLKGLRIPLKRAYPFITIDGKPYKKFLNHSKLNWATFSLSSGLLMR